MKTIEQYKQEVTEQEIADFIDKWSVLPIAMENPNDPYKAVISWWQYSGLKIDDTTNIQNLLVHYSREMIAHRKMAIDQERGKTLADYK